MRKLSVYVATASAVLAIAGTIPVTAYAGTVSYNIPGGRMTIVGGGSNAGCSQGTQSIRDILGNIASGNPGLGNTYSPSGNPGLGNTYNPSGNACNPSQSSRPGFTLPGGNSQTCNPPTSSSFLSRCPDILTPNLPDNGCTDNQRPGTDCPEVPCPDTQNPGTTDPGNGNPGTTDPGNGNPGTTDPGNGNPGTTDPGNGNPGITDPGNSNPGTTNPGTTKPGTQLPDVSDDYARQVVDLVNAERAKSGLSPLTIHSGAEDAALVRAQELEHSFSHTRPDGSNCNTALDQAGVSYQGFGENIAYGQRSPEEVMRVWMNSSGHRANILNKSFNAMGVGHSQDSAGTDYWCQLFLTE